MLEAFEVAPRPVQDLLGELCALADLRAETVRDLDQLTVARYALAEYCQTDDGYAVLTPLIPNVQDETMAIDLDTVVLGVPLLLALGGLVFIEADNGGPAGRIRWRLRLGRREGQDTTIAKELLRGWLLRVAGSRAIVPPSDDPSLKIEPPH